MYRVIPIFLLICLVAIAQTSPSPQNPANGGPKAPATAGAADASPKSPKSEEPKAAESEPGANLPAQTAVITIKHLCSATAGSATGGSATGAASAAAATSETTGGATAAGKSASDKPATSANCNTVITKAEFEKIVNAVVPKTRRAELPPTAKQQIAQQFTTLLVMATTAQKRGIEHKDPNVQEALKLSRQQVLAQSLNQELMDKATPSDAEVKKYYDQNPSAYDEVTLLRLFIPKAATADNAKPKDPNAEKADAEKLQARAAKGEDFDKLQKEAFANQANPQGAPSVQMGPRRRGTMPPDQEAVIFSTPAGSVTSLFDNPAGWYAYKVVSKRTVPLAEVKEEMVRKLQQQRYMDARNAITNSVETEFNEKYFGGAAEQGMHMPGMTPGGAKSPRSGSFPSAPAKPKPPAPAPPTPNTPASPPPQH